MRATSLQSCPTLRPPWILAQQARTLEWVAMPSSRGSSGPRAQTRLLHLLHWPGRGLGGGGPLPLTPPGKTIRCYENRKSSQHCVTRGKHAGSLRSWPEGSNPDLVKPLDPAADFQEAQRTEGHSEWCFADEVSQVHPVGSSMRQMVFLPK